MGELLLLQAVLLGIVEGLTEFLPVSSTGHLIIVGEFIGFTGEPAKTFEIFIQLGSILGVVWLYRLRLVNVAVHLNEPTAQRFAINILVAFIPAVILGLLFHKTIKEHLFNPLTVAGALVVGGFVILLIERLKPADRVTHVDQMTTTDAVKVGLMQCFALFPGVSRAGATIMGGMVVGLSRTTATEFSFFLAMPTMLAATTYDLYKNFHLLQAHDLTNIAVGFVTAFLTALVVVKVFLGFVARHNFVAFAWYRIVFGSFVFWLYI